MLEDFKIMGEAWNSNPSTSMGTLWLTIEVRHWPTGFCTNIGVFNSSHLMSCMSANYSEMNECDAPESNKTEAGTELTRSIPITVSGWS
jgi:hypothetical protein